MATTYHTSDPRAALAATPVGAKPVASPFAGAEYAKFYETPPAENQDGARTWYARGQNFIIAYSDADKGAVLARANQPDEYVVLLPDPGAGAEIVWGNERKVVNGRIPTCRRSSRGRRHQVIRRSAPTASTSRQRLEGSGGSFAARPSW